MNKPRTHAMYAIKQVTIGAIFIQLLWIAEETSARLTCATYAGDTAPMCFGGSGKSCLESRRCAMKNDRISEIEQRNKIILERFSPQGMAIHIEAAKEPYYTVVVENIRLDQQSIRYLLDLLKREREANAVMREALTEITKTNSPWACDAARAALDAAKELEMKEE